jgi:hypothetical protein
VLLLATSSAGAATAGAAPVDSPAIPQVQVPELTVPQVSAPSVPAPSVPAPSVPAPSAPAVPSVPQISAPAPSVPVVQVPAGGALSAGAALPGLPGAGSEARSGESIGPAGAAAGSVGLTAGAVAGRLLAAPPSGAFARDPQRRRAQLAAVRRVRRKLRPVRDCLHLLARRPRMALVLHLGLGDARPRSRQAVARRLRTSWRRVRRMERTSIARLRRADRAGACDEPGTPVTFLSLSGEGQEQASFALTALGGTAAQDAAAGGEVLGARDAGDARGQGGAGGSAGDTADSGANRGDRPIGLVETSTDDLQIIALIVGGLLAAGVAAAYLIGRLRRPDRHVK